RGPMTPEHALRYAAVLAVASFAILTWKVNLLSALLAQAGLWFYVGVYTVLLKRRTPLNTVIGGIAGSIPPLIGWAAATGRLDLAALVLFAVIDRKSTRLNSSHVKISYAVFCLKKKKDYI